MICKNAISPELPDLVRSVNPSVVQIRVQGDYGRKWRGSGVIVHEHGLILTARHVVEDSNDITVILSDGRKYKSIDKIADPNNDIGIVRIASLEDLPTIKFGKEVQTGEEVFIVGSPFGLFNSVALGIVAGEDRDVPYFCSEPLLQLDVAGNPGNSGCPAFNMSGKIVGILIGGMRDGDGITVVIPGDRCKKLLEDYVDRNN
ncbi:unnamed protein product [marine sediment metagenome]|uniref:Serine protease n=1 Tax=marine sediment metagenome TaxID=412755 RepID=X0T1W5_9ZZZZ